MSRVRRAVTALTAPEPRLAIPEMARSTEAPQARMATVVSNPRNRGDVGPYQSPHARPGPSKASRGRLLVRRQQYQLYRAQGGKPRPLNSARRWSAATSGLMRIQCARRRSRDGCNTTG